MAKHIHDIFEEKARAGDGQFAIAFALLEIAQQQKACAYQLERLGIGNAATPMGAIELLSKGLNEGASEIAEAIRGIELPG